MSELKDILKNIKDIKKEMHDKNVEIQKIEEKKTLLNEEIEMCVTKISWLQEDIEDMVHESFYNVEYVKTQSDHIEIKFKENAILNLADIMIYAKKIDKDLKDFNIFSYNDKFFLRITLWGVKYDYRYSKKHWRNWRNYKQK